MSKKMTIEDLSKTVQKGFEAINSRLDRIEQRLDILESLPTNQKELKLQKTNK